MTCARYPALPRSLRVSVGTPAQNDAYSLGGLVMSMRRALFLDRDGTLIEEPPDEQIEQSEKVRLMPGVFAALRRAAARRVSTSSWSRTRMASARQLSAGGFDCAHEVHPGAVRLPGHRVRCRVRSARTSRARDCDCRKPKTGWSTITWRPMHRPVPQRHDRRPRHGHGIAANLGGARLAGAPDRHARRAGRRSYRRFSPRRAERARKTRRPTSASRWS